MRIKAWHGTNQAFDRFDSSFLGAASGVLSSVGFFFSQARETAQDYARFAADRRPEYQADLEAKISIFYLKAAEAEESGNWALAEVYESRAEKADLHLRTAPAQGARILEVQLDVDHPLRLKINGFIPSDALRDRLIEAREAGCDAVILESIQDAPSGGAPDTHVVIFDTDRITILNRFDLDLDASMICKVS